MTGPEGATPGPVLRTGLDLPGGPGSDLFRFESGKTGGFYPSKAPHFSIEAKKTGIWPGWED
jgi:hypothetical protein